MRRILWAATVGVALAALAIATSVSEPPTLPAIGPDVERLCAEVMRRSPADRVWVAWDYMTHARGRDPIRVTLGSLRMHGGQLVRVAGFLHVEFESVALYATRADMTDWRGPGGIPAPWVHLGVIWPDEPYWRKRGPDISDRCAVVVGIHDPLGSGHMGMYTGEITALRLEVWSVPHRPDDDAPPVPPLVFSPSRRSE